jgi:hypothetical protein
MSKFQPVEYPYNRAGSCHFHKLCDRQTTLQFAYNITWEVQGKEVLRGKRNKNELKFQKGRELSGFFSVIYRSACSAP